MKNMQLAILFWFYKEPGICQNRLELLRKYNPSSKIYGLYGGDVNLKHLFAKKLSRYLDDLFCFESNSDPSWKWQNGDLLITEWYRQRGRDLPWDSIVIAQWDMLIFAPVDKIFSTVPEGQILLSGLRSIEREAKDWVWVTSPEGKKEYNRFLNHVRKHYNYNDDPIFCIFIVVVFSRDFLEEYSMINEPEIGFIEYRVPIFAQIFNIGIFTNHNFTVSSPGESLSEDVLSLGRQIPFKNVLKNILSSSGARIFHPYHDYYPHNIHGLVFMLMVFLEKLLIKPAIPFLNRHLLWRFKRTS
jgi:hypothetical protein